MKSLQKVGQYSVPRLVGVSIGSVSLLLATAYCGTELQAQTPTKRVSGGSELVVGQKKNSSFLAPRVPWSRGALAADFFKAPGVLELCEAIDRGDKEAVEELLASGVDPDTRGKHGATSLMWCMPLTDNGVFELLLKRGADPNVEFKYQFVGSPPTKGATVTLCVARYCSTSALRTVLQYKGDPNCESVAKWKGEWVPSGDTCLVAAVGSGVERRVAKVRLLLERGANPNVKTKVMPVLTVAIWRKRLECALVLLAAGANPSLYDGQHMLPCHYLAEHLASDQLSPADKDRVLLLMEKTKRGKAWRPNAFAEVVEYRRLRKVGKREAAREYMHELRKQAERTGP